MLRPPSLPGCQRKLDLCVLASHANFFKKFLHARPPTKALAAFSRANTITQPVFPPACMDAAVHRGCEACQRAAAGQHGVHAGALVLRPHAQGTSWGPRPARACACSRGEEHPLPHVSATVPHACMRVLHHGLTWRLCVVARSGSARTGTTPPTARASTTTGQAGGEWVPPSIVLGWKHAAIRG